MGSGGQHHTPAALLREGDTVTIAREAGWVPGAVWKGTEKLAHPQPGFDPRTAQPEASQYTDCAIPAQHDY
jgi:hypothetical protein